MGIEIADQAWTAMVAGVIGGLIGSSLRWIEQRLERRRRRRAVATALLDDLRLVEVDARQLVETDRPAATGGTRAGSVFRRITNTDDLFLFSPETVNRLLYVVMLTQTIAEISKAFQDASSPKVRFHREVRARAHFLANHVARVKQALIREGGTPPPAEPLPMLDGSELPALPPFAFPEWTIPPAPPARSAWVDESGREVKGIDPADD